MFTGIIEQVGTVISNGPLEGGDFGNRLVVEASFQELEAGESIAVNGACLTWLPKSETQLSFDLSPETLEQTVLGSLVSGDKVNLERAMKLSTRLGGHYVCGHVNKIARLKSKRVLNDFLELTLSGFISEDHQFLVPKGSITLDGVSLTINHIVNGDVVLMVIPFTAQHTTLGELAEGKKVNVEFDYIAHIVAHNLSLRHITCNE